jgi:CDP-diacylglycerol--glycerol-3-phosphate 3-phosphatidyltransferase
MVSGLRQIAAARGVVIAAGQWGKWKTVSQIVAIIALILENTVRISVPVGMILYYIAVALTVLSGIQYLYRYRKILREDTEDTI